MSAIDLAVLPRKRNTYECEEKRRKKAEALM
jgi:hypothetical protein